MTDEAEKVINLSLCKMAESRAIRRGGNSLHKHLLIASVLTKARSAYFENWYLGDNDCSSVSSSPYSPQQSNSQGGPPSSQSHNRRGSNLMASSANNGLTGPSSSSQQQSVPEDDEVSINNNHIIDPRFFVEVESEIELPSDILNCVEKLSDMGGDMSFMSDSEQDSIHHHVNRNPSASGVIHEVDEIFEESDRNAEMILSDVVVSIDEDIDVVDSNPSEYTSLCSSDNSRSTLTYLDLDARPPTPNKSSDSSFYSSSSSALISSASNAVVIQPIILPVSNSCPSSNNNNHSSNSVSNTSTKRRRGWSFDEDEDLYTDEELTQQFPDELNQKLKKNGVSVTNMAKRLRFSGDSFSSNSSSSSGFCSGNESRTDLCQAGEDENEQSSSSSLPNFTFKRSSFRTKKSHFEELEEEDDAEDDSEDDSFLADDLGQGSWCDGKSKDNSHKNDRRVPSASSSGSCSDEEADSNSMEVDQLTSLVQYISFKHQQQQQQHSQNGTCASAASSITSASSVLGLSDTIGVVVTASSGNGGGLIRSMSSPDLCTRAAAVSSSVSQVNKSNAKDLFSSYNSAHRVLTMTV